MGLSLRKVSIAYTHHNFIFVDLPELDITDEASVFRAVEDNGIDAIINCAAYTAVDKAETETELARRVNAYGAQVVAEVARKRGLKLIHISTDFVFGNGITRPLTEDDIAAPLNVYGATKLEGERLVETSGADAVVIRTSWLYSEFGNNFVKTMLRLADTRDALSVVDDQRGGPTYAVDLARAIMHLLERGVKGYELYHFSDEGDVSRFELAVETLKLAGKTTTVNPVDTAFLGQSVERPMYSVLDCSKIKAAGVCVPAWKDSLRECMSALGYAPVATAGR